MKNTLLIVICLSWLSNTSAQLNKNAALQLIKRVIPAHAAGFVVEPLSKESEKDVFELESKNGKIILRGNNGISVASALNYYLKNYAHCDIGWNGTNLKLPQSLPPVTKKIRKTSPYKYRHYFNYCTFNYTGSWWDWSRWEKEIDFMALNGINMPLAMTGQNSVWYRVYKSMGFSDQDMKEFFSGPAYFMWFWAGNLDGWGGPLPQSFMKWHEDLQKKIVARQRELGIMPVLPAFTGHVPPAFSKRFPNAKVQKTNWEGRFDSTYLLDPTDPMFITIGKKFIEEQTKTFGTDHLYGADTFNEMYPPSGDSMYLNNIGKAVYKSMTAADPKAIWVMQGWLFWDKRDFWKPTQIQAYLNGVPNEHMVVLDLWSEVQPIWNKTNAYYGKPWIWCMLHNFGGRLSMFGNMKKVGTEPATLLNKPEAGNLTGIGAVPEGIEQNPIMYALLMENIWNDQPIDLDKWVSNYIFRRYGSNNADAQKAWNILQNSVYNTFGWQGPESIITGRPTFKKDAPFVATGLPYKATDLLQAWKLLASAAGELQQSDGYQYDLLDITRQAMANYAKVVQQQFAVDFKNKDLDAFRTHSQQFLQLIGDMDQLLATRKDFLLGKWLQDAKKVGTTNTEKELYEKNARNIITTWGDENSALHDYANKQWSGLLNGFYKPRWQQFIDHMTAALQNNREPDYAGLDKQLKQWEWKWVNGHELYTDRPAGDPVKTAQQMYDKYYGIIEKAYQNKPEFIEGPK